MLSYTWNASLSNLFVRKSIADWDLRERIVSLSHWDYGGWACTWRQILRWLSWISIIWYGTTSYNQKYQLRIQICRTIWLYVSCLQIISYIMCKTIIIVVWYNHQIKNGKIGLYSKKYHAIRMSDNFTFSTNKIYIWMSIFV